MLSVPGGYAPRGTTARHQPAKVYNGGFASRICDRVFLRFTRFSTSNHTLHKSVQAKSQHVVTSCPEISTTPLTSFRRFINSPHVVPGSAAPDCQRVLVSTIALTLTPISPLAGLHRALLRKAAASSAYLFACEACTVHIHKWEPSSRPEPSDTWDLQFRQPTHPLYFCAFVHTLTEYLIAVKSKDFEAPQTRYELAVPQENKGKSRDNRHKSSAMSIK